MKHLEELHILQRYFLLLSFLTAFNDQGSFFKPLPVASRVILPGCSVEDTIAVIIPLKTFIFGRWKDSKEAALPLAPAR